jgi:hypothetical protein
MNRERAEQEIVRCEKVFHDNVHMLCADDTALRGFLAAWYELVRYYESIDDRSISIEIIRIYMETRHFLHNMSQRSDLAETCRVMAKESLLHLDSFMTDITHLVDRRLYPNSW